jgi:hypothetical protein
MQPKNTVPKFSESKAGHLIRKNQTQVSSCRRLSRCNRDAFVAKLKPLLERQVSLPLLLLLTAVMLLAQKPSHRNQPSPADSGILERPAKPKGPQPEMPQPPPPTDDPNGGISADDERDDPSQGDEPDVNNDETPIDDNLPPPTVQVAATEIWRIGNGSDVGKAGDWMLVLRGQGFFESERPPIVHIGEGIVLTDVYVAKQGQEIFANVPAEVALQIIASDFEKIWVQNPGGLNRDPRRWVPFPIQRPSFVAGLESASKATFKFGEYFLERGK